jgi:hypothetical protein
MSYPVFQVPAGDVLPVMFASYAGSTGASVTLTGLAVTDIEIFKDGSTTQRASDAGYTLLDTDGIDFDGITGIHGFSIDTGDNTDASFYTVGAWFTVVVSAVTVDSQTVNFIACQFRIMAAESVAGTPAVDVTAISSDATAANNAEAFFDGTGYAGTNNVIPTVTTTTTATNVTTVNGLAAGVITAASIAADAITDAKVAADVTIASVTGAVGSVTGNVGGNVVGSVGSVGIGGIDDVTLTVNALETIADTLLDRNMATGTDSGTTSIRTVRQALRVMRNKVAIAAGTATIYKEDDSTSSWTAAVTTTAGDPISAVDPAGP